MSCSDTPTGYDMTMRKVADCTNFNILPSMKKPQQLPLQSMIKFDNVNKNLQSFDSQTIKREFVMRKLGGNAVAPNVFYNEQNLKDQYC